MAFTIRQLTFFSAAAEYGSVSHAAQGLNISQSSVTEAIQHLEADLGVDLFDRHARGLTLTARGQQFYRHAARILASVSDARHSFVRNDPGMDRPRLHVGVTPLVAGYILSDLLARFRRQAPMADITLIEENSDHLEHLLIGGELDVAIMVIDDPRDAPALHLEIFESSPYRLWVPAGHRLAGSEIVEIADLDGEAMIVLRLDETERNILKVLAREGCETRLAFRSGSVEAVRSLVSIGAGIALLPDLIFRQWSLDGNRLERRIVSGPLPQLHLGIAWRRGSALPAVAADFIALARQHSRHSRIY